MKSFPVVYKILKYDQKARKCWFLYRAIYMKNLKIHYKKTFNTPLESPTKVVWKKYLNFFTKINFLGKKSKKVKNTFIDNSITLITKKYFILISEVIFTLSDRFENLWKTSKIKNLFFLPKKFLFSKYF